MQRKPKDFKETVAGAFVKAKAWYHSEKVEMIFNGLMDEVRNVATWIRNTIKANPEAAMAGAIAASVVIIALSVITLGFVISVALCSGAAYGAHHYFRGVPAVTE